jgi:hypothetical protein
MSNSSSEEPIEGRDQYRLPAGPSAGAKEFPRILLVEVQNTVINGVLVRIGLSIRFNIQMDATRVENPANYRLLEAVEGGGTPRFRAIAVRLRYDVPSHTAILLWDGRPEFALGGNLTINGTPPVGLAESDDLIFLAGDDTGRPGTDATVLILQDAAGAVLQ